jgi:glycosyltransferase involved in cell wall biosynthesis
MKFGLYIDPAFQSSAGIELYTRELIKGICRSDLSSHFLFLSTRRAWAEEAAQRMTSLVPAMRPKVVTYNASPRALWLAWSLAGLPIAERMIGEDLALMHNPFSIRIPARSCPVVVTVHDVYPTRLPSLLTFRQRLSLAPQKEAQAIRHATHIIADSMNTKRDICALFEVSPGKVSVVPLGVDHDIFKPVGDVEHIRRTTEKYGIDGKFILYVGSLYSHKLGRLLEAFRMVCSASEEQYKLVIVGGRESYIRKEGNLCRRVQELDLEHRVILTGVVPQEDIPVLMSATEVFVYVSLFEGFGLTPLEAMACGAPIVASNTTSLPEVVGDAGLLVSPSDEHEIAAAILKILANERIGEQFRARSLERARLFSWARTVQQTFEVYRMVAC